MRCIHSVGGRSRPILCVLTVAALVSLTSCSKEELQQAIETAKQTTEATTTKVAAAAKEVLPETGHVHFRFAEPNHPLAKASVDRAIISLTPIGMQRPAVVQISNLTETTPPSRFPRVLLSASTQTDRIEDLANTQLAFDLYLQTSPDEVAMTAAGQTVQVSFGAWNPKQKSLGGEMSLARIVDQRGEELVLRGGELVAITQE